MSQDTLPGKVNVSNDGDKKNIGELSDETVTKSKADPLARFEAEISMDGESFSENLSSWKINSVESTLITLDLEF